MTTTHHRVLDTSCASAAGYVQYITLHPALLHVWCPLLFPPCSTRKSYFVFETLGYPLGLFQLQLQQQQAEGASRQDAARLGAMNSKLTKDFNRINPIALDLGAQVRAGGIAWRGS